MREYEEQYENQVFFFSYSVCSALMGNLFKDMVDNRLPPIMETENLEKQFTDLEQEFEDFKAYHEGELFKKEEEISILHEKLNELELKQQRMQEAAVQADADAEEERAVNKMKNFTSYVIEHTCRYDIDFIKHADCT